MKEYRILHLEDSQDDADLVKRLLQKADIKFQYFFADTQSSFVKGLTEFHPDVILCDHALPQFDSVMAFDIYQEMKLEIPFILVTGSVSEEYAVEMIKKGIDDYLLKTNLQRLPLAIESAFLKRENEKKVKEGIKKLEYSELMMREAQKIAHLGNWELNFETGIGLWSDEACRIYGLSPEDNKQTFETWISFIHPDDLEYVMKIVNESQKTLINSKMNHRIVLKDGTIKHIHSESKFKMDSTGKPIGLNGIAQDITERKKAKEKLLLSESTLKKAQEIARIGSWRTDLTTGTMECSEEICKIYGFEPDENQQTLDMILSFVHPEDINFVKKEIEKTTTTLNDNSFYYRIIRKDGSIRNVYVSFRYDVNTEGKSISRYGITHDVTDRIKAEEALQLNYSELKKINSELDRFVYSISHELRSPLTSIMGLMNIINYEKLGDGNDKPIDLINRSVLKMDETLREILDYSRNSRNEIKREELDIASIIDGAFENSNYYKEGFVFDKRIYVQGREPFYSDPARIKVIINNLVSNALKYGKKYFSDSFIEIKIVIDNKKMILEISDNGIGIKTEHQPKLFEMFFRATAVSSGTGLGLYIAKECVEKLNGTITVESEFGKGTKFTLEIPNNKPLLK